VDNLAQMMARQPTPASHQNYQRKMTWPHRGPGGVTGLLLDRLASVRLCGQTFDFVVKPNSPTWSRRTQASVLIPFSFHRIRSYN